MRYFVTPNEVRRLDATARQALRGSFVPLSDGVTHYELTGPEQGEVAVLVGGMTVPLFYWDGLAAELHHRGFRTLAYSVYGRGYSDRVQARYDEELFVRQLTDLTASLGLTRRCHVVATSMGAVIAMAYAGQQTGRISTLSLFGPAGLARRASPPAWLLHNDRVAALIARRLGHRMLEKHLGHNVREARRADQLVAMVLDAYRYEGSMYALFATLRDLRLSGRAGLYNQTRALGLPTMLSWGTDDHVIPAEEFELARTLLEPQQCHRIDDCGHMPPFERPHDVADLLSAFTASYAERLGP